MADQPAKLQQLDKKRKDERKRVERLKAEYKKIENSPALIDLLKHLEEESETLMRTVKNRFTVVEGKVVPLDDGASLSLLYKSAGLDMAAQYIKGKLS